MNYETEAAACTRSVNEALASAVPAETPEPLGEAMRYALLSPGKRLRPVMLIKSHALLAEPDDGIVRFSTGLEMIHAYSLIHDDLPAMDNDTLRRGRPTCHVAFGEGMAILAGDGLLNLAFETMLCSPHPRAALAARWVSLRSGVRGMVGGQGLDIAAEGQTADRDLVARLQTGKTAALFMAAAEAGLTLAGADEAQLQAGRAYALGFGRAFQIIDDILDIEGDEQQLGKSVGKDEAEGKLTWPAAVGIDQARRDARTWTDRAVEALEPFGERAAFLRETALRALRRIS